MKKEKESSGKSEKERRQVEEKKSRTPRPVSPSTPNLGFHGKDKEKDLNPEE